MFFGFAHGKQYPTVNDFDQFALATQRTLVESITTIEKIHLLLHEAIYRSYTVHQQALEQHPKFVDHLENTHNSSYRKHLLQDALYS
jgi:hypothetical protein